MIQLFNSDAYQLIMIESNLNSFGIASDDGLCRLFDLKSYQTLNVYGNGLKDANAVTFIDFSRSGYYLAASYDDGPMCLSWNTVTAQLEKETPHVSRVSALEFNNK